LGDYRQVQDIFFPFAIRLSDAQGAQQVSLVYREVSVGPVPSAALFRLDTPTGVEEIDIDAYRLHSP
jgi:outer membrane lipoprotein-sorting protein